MVDMVEETKREDRLAEYEGVDRIWNSGDAFDHFKTKPKPKVFNSQIGKLNQLLGGFKPGEIVVITGKSGDGKTTLARSLTYDFTEQDPEKRSLWLTYELPPASLLDRFEENGMPFFYLPINLEPANITWFEDRIIETKCKYGALDAVFLDHLHYIVPPAKYQNMSVVIGQAMREFVRITQQHGIVLFLIAHVRNIEQEKAAHKEDIRDSSFVVQESDTVIVVRRILPHHQEYDEKNPNRATLAIEKNRRIGTLGNISVTLNGGRYYEEVS